MRKPDIDPLVIDGLATRVLGGNRSLAIARAGQGGSTQVYRIGRGAETFYLRVAETAEVGHLGPEALTHRLLRERGVLVPEIVHYDPFDEALGRSFTVTTEIPGCPLADTKALDQIPAILHSAGRDLAVVNSLSVAGFGWVISDPAPSHLTAELPTHRAFVFEHFDADLSRLRDDFLTSREVAAIQTIVARNDATFNDEDAYLAHGDFDISHIYHQHGRYRGIIDFGEIRGADRHYDLGHYAAHDGQLPPNLTLDYLLQGYRDMMPLCDQHEASIHLWALLIALRRLAIAADRPAPAYQRHLNLAVRRAITALEGLQ